jgi:hypothetical protein
MPNGTRRDSQANQHSWWRNRHIRLEFFAAYNEPLHCQGRSQNAEHYGHAQFELSSSSSSLVNAEGHLCADSMTYAHSVKGPSLTLKPHV